MRSLAPSFALAMLVLGGAATAAPPPSPPLPAPATPPEPPPCQIDPDALATWVPASYDASVVVDLAGLRRAMPTEAEAVLTEQLLFPLARSGFPLAAAQRLVVNFRPYRGKPDVAVGVAEGPELAAAVRVWTGGAPGAEAVVEGDGTSLRLREVGGRLHFTLAGGGAAAPFLRDDLGARPEASVATRYPCLGDGDTLYALRLRRQRPTFEGLKDEAGKPSGPIAWVRDYHLDLRAHGKGLEGVGNFLVQMPMRQFLWPLFGHIGMQVLEDRLKGCSSDLAGDPAGAWIDAIGFDTTREGVELRWAGPARELEAAVPGLRRIVLGEVGCSRRSLPAALRDQLEDEVPAAPEAPAPASAPAQEPAKPTPPAAPKTPRGWLW